jgi:hypothetical protein
MAHCKQLIASLFHCRVGIQVMIERAQSTENQELTVFFHQFAIGPGPAMKSSSIEISLHHCRMPLPSIPCPCRGIARTAARSRTEITRSGCLVRWSGVAVGWTPMIGVRDSEDTGRVLVQRSNLGGLMLL